MSTESEQSEERLEEDNDDDEAMPVVSENDDVDTNFPTEIEEDDDDDGHIPPDLYGEPEPDEDIAAENSYDYQNSYQDAQKPETADLSWYDFFLFLVFFKVGKLKNTFFSGRTHLTQTMLKSTARTMVTKTKMTTKNSTTRSKHRKTTLTTLTMLMKMSPFRHLILALRTGKETSLYTLC